MAHRKPEGKERGPEPETLKIEGDWEKAVQKALRKKPLARPKAKRKRR